MAILGTGTGDALFENMMQAAQYTFNEQGLLKNLVTLYDMTGTAGLTASVPVWPRVTGLTALAAGAEASSTHGDPISKNITAAEYATMATMQDIVLESSPTSVAQDMGAVLGGAIARAEDEAICSIFVGGAGDDAHTDMGPGAGVEMTAANIMKAGAKLRANSVPTENMVAVLSPAQAYAVKATLLTAGGQFGNNSVANEIAQKFFIGSINGVDIYESAAIAEDENNDSIGAVFHPAAIGFVQKRALRLATQRDESLRATEIVASAAFAAGILDVAKIVKLTSDGAL
jgi:hypothetical protein